MTSAPFASPVVVVPAAGHGARMNSPLPAALHPICGRPMVAWPVRAALAAGAHRVVVVGGPDRALAPHLPERTALVVQTEARGTGDAVRCAAGHIDGARPVVVLAGDVPLITADTLAQLLVAHCASGAAATMLTMRLEDPTGYGRVVRDERGDIVRVAETRRPGDATLTELAIREVNTGVLCFDGAALLDVLDSAQGELRLPDVLPLLRAAGHRIAACETADHAVCLGVDDQADLAEVRALAQRRIAEEHLRAGVTIVDPARTVIDADVRIGAGTVIEPGCQLEGRTTDRRRLPGRPARHDARLRARRRRLRAALGGQRRDDRRARHRRAVRLPAPRRTHRRRRQGGDVRGDQEPRHHFGGRSAATGSGSRSVNAAP